MKIKKRPDRTLLSVCISFIITFLTILILFFIYDKEYIFGFMFIGFPLILVYFGILYGFISILLEHGYGKFFNYLTETFVAVLKALITYTNTEGKNNKIMINQRKNLMEEEKNTLKEKRPQKNSLEESLKKIRRN